VLISRLLRLERRVSTRSTAWAEDLNRRIIVYTKDEDREELIRQARERGVTGTLIVCPAFDPDPISPEVIEARRKRHTAPRTTEGTE
jgi:hypothetical protein